MSVGFFVSPIITHPAGLATQVDRDKDDMSIFEENVNDPSPRVS
jgi:hypothetical protein